MKKETYKGTEAKQDKLFRFIVEYKQGHDGNSPSLSEMTAAVGFSSKSVTSYHLGMLEKDGRIIRDNGSNTRGIRIPGGQWIYQGTERAPF